MQKGRDAEFKRCRVSEIEVRGKRGRGAYRKKKRRKGAKWQRR